MAQTNASSGLTPQLWKEKTMPSVSKKQARFMAAVAHNPAFAKKVNVPQSVGEEFNAADERISAKGLPNGHHCMTVGCRGKR